MSEAERSSHISILSNDELIEIAAGVLNPYFAKDRLFGDVASALVSHAGQMYRGVSVDTASWGLCAERSAIASMITAGYYRIRKIVAVWKDERTGRLHVLPPCGICREFMRNVDRENLDAEVVLSRTASSKLRELLPLHDWPEPLDQL